MLKIQSFNVSIASLSQLSVHDKGVHKSLAAVVEGIRYHADHLETYAFPEVHGDGVGTDHEIELHRCETQASGLIQRPKRHFLADPLPCGLRRYHIRGVPNV